MDRDPIYYVYDRVCTKEGKQSEILREYGDIQIRTANPSRDRLYHSEFAEAQRRRAEAARHSGPSRPGYTADDGKKTSSSGSFSGGGASRSSAGSTGGSRAYTYRPGAAEGGEAVQEGGFSWFGRIFTTLEERGIIDVQIAKKQAAAIRKLREYRHVFFTAFILTLVTVFAVFGAYKLFFVIRGTTVSGSERYAEEEILDASGIGEGDNLYSFRASDAEARITFLCPYIRTAAVSRSVPVAVTVAVEDDYAVYCAEIWDDTMLLSGGLRVLEVLRSGDEVPAGVVKLILPPVDKSVAGRVLRFTNARSERYIRAVLASASASRLMQDGLLDEIDLTEEYDITMRACGRRVKFSCANEADMDLKLRMAYAIVNSDQFDHTNRARVDLSQVGEASVMYDFAAAED